MKNGKKVAAGVAITLAGVVALAGCSASTSPSASPSAKASSTLKTISQGVVRVGAQSDNPPYSYVVGTDDRGYTTELVKDMAKRLDLKPQVVYLDFSALIPSVVSGSLDIAASSISDTPEREKIVDFGLPMLFGPEAVLATKSSGITSNPASLTGKRLAVLQGTIQDTYATDNWKAQVVRFPDQNSQYAALKTGTVDALFGDQPLAATTAAANPKLKIVITIIDKTSPFAIAFNKKNPALRDAFNKQFKALVADGTVEKLQKKYLPGLPIADQFKPKG